MPKHAAPKTDLTYRSAKPKTNDYLVPDGGGLNLLVKVDGTKSWLFRYRFLGKEKKIALGRTYPEMTIKQAREKAEAMRSLIADGTDPLQERRDQRRELEQRQMAKLKEEAKSACTFEKVAREWMEVWMLEKSDSTRRGVLQRFERHVFPFLGSRPIDEITPPELLGMLRRVELQGRFSTAHRILGACGEVMKFAVTSSRASRNISTDLHRVLKSAKTQHRSALTDPSSVGQLLRDIDAYQGYWSVRYALRLLPLVFTRPGELRLAEWTEFDFARAQWDIPEGRMKMRVSHIVPLSNQALEILRELRSLGLDDKVLFPTPRQKHKPISNVALLNGLRRMGYGSAEQSAHGFRAIARTLLDERLRVHPTFIEAQLAHVPSDSLGAAYNRTQHLEARKEMMQQWADYLDELKASNPARAARLAAQQNLADLPMQGERTRRSSLLDPRS